MASSAFIAFLLVLSFAVQIHARDSQFFSKVTSKPTETVVLPDKEAEQRSLVNKTEPEQQPEFVPQNQDGHGLYGHETGVFPPETETETKTDSGEYYEGEKYYNNDKNGGFTEQFQNSNGDTFYANNGEKVDTSSETQKEDLLNFDNVFDETKDRSGETFYSNNRAGTERYTADNVRERYDNADRSGRFGSQLGATETYYNDNRFDKGFTNELNARYNDYRASQRQNGGWSSVERKGMSDTRFVENGRYYYDLNKEQNQYASQNTYKPKYETDEFGTRAYGNNEVVGTSGNRNYNYNDDVYDNSGGEKYEFNTMEEYEKSRLNRYDP